MEGNAKIYVAGHTGLVGSALVRCLTGRGYRNLLLKTMAELDLTRQAEVESFFSEEKPEYVFIAAAKVGGILANKTLPGDFIYINQAIQNNVIQSAFKSGTKRLLFLGSSCIYPKDCPQPIREDYLLTGELESTNEAYAIAKIAGIKMCEAYYKQFGSEFFSVMPTNLFGPGDNYDLKTSHVMPALIRKFYEAQKFGQPEVVVWGSGSPRREFLFVDDMAEGCVFLMNLPKKDLKGVIFSGEKNFFVNLGTGQDISIKELAHLIAQELNYNGKIIFDHNFPDGTARKLLNVDKLKRLGFEPKVDLVDGIRMTIQHYVKHSCGNNS